MRTGERPRGKGRGPIPPRRAQYRQDEKETADTCQTVSWCKSCKPGSVAFGSGIYARELPPKAPCHLSTTAVSRRLKQPTPRRRTSSPTYSRYTRSCNPRDVLPDDIAASAVGSYPAFSPLPLRAVVLCYACHTLTNVRPLTCAVLYVARTFLSPPRRAATRRTCASKDTLFFWKLFNLLRKKRTFVATNASNE